MTFDDQLKRAFDTLSERLRAEVDRQVNTVMENLATAARADRDQATHDAREIAAREAAGTFETTVVAARQEAYTAGLAAGKDEGRREGLEAGRSQGVEEGREQGEQEGRAQGVQEGRAQGLQEGRAQGLQEGREHGRQEGREQGIVEGREQGLQEGQLRGVLEGRQQAEQEGREALDAALATRTERVAQPADADRLAEAVRSIGRGRSLSEILDTLVHVAGQESTQATVWLVGGGHLQKWRASADDAAVPLDATGPIAEAARTADVATSDEAVAVPMLMAGQVVAVLSATSPGSSMTNPGAIEVIGRYAARCLEAATAFKAARALTERPGDAAAAAGGGDQTTAEDDVSARRYARLLVSEIKLYHEPAVVEGRRDRDLATRLGGEIARARVLYEQRVPPQVRQRADYFHEELVRTLANGDSTLLQLT